MTAARGLLFLAVSCAVCIVTLHGEVNPGNSNNERLSKLQHIKEQFEVFKRELEAILAESSVQACDCDDKNPQKRCPSGCGQPKTIETAEATEAEKRCPNGCKNDLRKICEQCDDSDPVKRCPTECAKNTRTVTSKADCIRRCPTCPECQQDQQQPTAAVAESQIMKRFLKALPVQDQQLVQNSRAKKQFIERLISRSHYGPNKNDVAAAEQSKASRVLDIGVRALPAENNKIMLAFKRGLSTKEQQLLKNFNSKSRFIEGLLEKQSAQDKRDVDINSKKEKSTDCDSVLIPLLCVHG